ncbi:hypothetical protein G5B39_10080 [Rhodobacteraceae bacterium SC52]|nr:hypothetical protein G5B39_10080 [Rhodobacteraceae bacterium SC52]
MTRTSDNWVTDYSRPIDERVAIRGERYTAHTATYEQVEDHPILQGVSQVRSTITT